MQFTIIFLNCDSRLVTLQSHEKRGKDLLQHVFTLLELNECTKYFGLSYRDREDGDTNWLAETDDLSSTLAKVKTLQFGVRFYPKQPEDEILDDKALELFCLHLKELLVKGELACDVELHAYLDGLLAQAKLGNYRPSRHKTGYLKTICGVEICAPTFLNSNRDIKEFDYLRLVGVNHRRNIGMNSIDAYLMFVGKVKLLPYFGFSLHPAKSKQGNTVILGLSERGFTVINDKVIDRLEHPKETEFFHWSGLRYCERSRGKILLGFETGADNLRELSYKVKSKNSFCGAERLRRDVFGYRGVFAKEGSDFYRSKRKAAKQGIMLPDDRGARRGVIPFVRLNSIGETLRRSFKMKKHVRSRMKRGSEGDITAEFKSTGLDETERPVTPTTNTTTVMEVTQITVT